MTRIRERLQIALGPCTVQVQDDSHLHIGHAGARDGRGHYTVTVTADAFEGKSQLARHRLVYQALGDLMDTDIHALAIRAHTTKEVT